MWIEGNQEIRPITNVNLELMETLKGELDNKTAQISLAKFLRHNVGLTTELMMGVLLEPFQEIMIRAFFDRNFSMLVYGRGLGKTLTYKDSSMVITKKDGLISIKELFKDLYFGQDEYWLEFPEIELWNGESWQKTNKILVQPTKRCQKIITKSGYSLEGSTNHKIQVFNTESREIVWKVFNEIKEGDLACISRKPDELKKETPEREADECYLMGLISGDGNISPGSSRSRITNNDSEIGDFLVGKFGCSRPKIREGESPEFHLKSRIINPLMEKYNCVRGYSESKLIPSEILKNRERTRYFLMGLFDSDGFCSPTITSVCVASTCFQKIQQVQVALLRFGIISKLKSIVAKHTKLGMFYTLIISGADFHLFFKEIGFRLTRKANRYLIHKNKSVNTNIDLIYNIIPLIFELKKLAKYKLLDSPWFGTGKIPIFKNKVNCSYAILKRSLDAFDRAENSEYLKQTHQYILLSKIYNNYFFFDPIVSISEPFEENCIDFNIPEGHKYWANGFVNHNTFLAAIYCLLKCVFEPGTRIVIASINFRTARRIFSEIERFTQGPNATLMRQCLGKLSRRADEFEWQINGGKITAIPLNGEKVRGIRADTLILDEFLLLPEQIISNVLMPFLSSPRGIAERGRIRQVENELIEGGLLHEDNRMIFENTSQMIALSSASYTFEHLYKVYSQWSHLIDYPSDNELTENDRGQMPPTYFIGQMSYEAAPPHMVDYGLIDAAKNGGSSHASFLREYCARFIDGGDGFFSPVKMNQVTFPDGEKPTTKIIGDSDPNKIYILGIDPNVNASQKSDYFAMCLIEAEVGSLDHGTVVHNYQLAAGTVNDHIRYFCYLLTRFNIKLIIGDNQGLSQFLDACNSSKLFQELKLKMNIFDPDIDILEVGEKYEKMLQNAINLYAPESGKMAVSQVFSNDWISQSNDYLQACIDHKRIWFASRAGSHPDSLDMIFEASSVPVELVWPKGELEIADTEVDTKVLGLRDLSDRQDDLIKDLKEQCANIEVSTTAKGSRTFDLPVHLRNVKSAHRPRKDNYSALLLANWGLKIYKEICDPNKKKVRREFTPILLY